MMIMGTHKTDGFRSLWWGSIPEPSNAVQGWVQFQSTPNGCFYKLGGPFVGVLITRALLLEPLIVGISQKP